MSDSASPEHEDESNAMGGYGTRYNRLSYADDYLEMPDTGDSE